MDSKLRKLIRNENIAVISSYIVAILCVVISKSHSFQRLVFGDWGDGSVVEITGCS